MKKQTLRARGRGELVPLASGRVVLERDVRIPVRDGITLSADVFRPAAGPPVPAILEHVPYRKDDVTAVRDRRLGRALAERGFALVCLDVRGTGRSDGIAVDEYTEAEQEDGAEAVEWTAAQEWCSGAVGAYGVSYGGFAAIQVAMRRPPALRAIAAVYSTDDRYTDDVHFYGGALCALELVHYPLRMVAMNGLPPGGSLGERGREAWRARIDATPPGSSTGCRSSAMVRTGGTARSGRRTSRSCARRSSSVAGATVTSTLPCGWPSGSRPPGSS